MKKFIAAFFCIIVNVASEMECLLLSDDGSDQARIAFCIGFGRGMRARVAPRKSRWIPFRKVSREMRWLTLRKKMHEQGLG